VADDYALGSVAVILMREIIAVLVPHEAPRIVSVVFAFLFELIQCPFGQNVE